MHVSEIYRGFSKGQPSRSLYGVRMEKLDQSIGGCTFTSHPFVVERAELVIPI